MRRFIAFAALLISIRAFAAPSPKTIGFMGVLNAANGTRASGSVTVTLALYTQPTGGIAAWTEQQTVSVVNGLFTTALGSVTAFPSSLDFSQSYYVGVTIAGDSAELAPRIPLQGVPYAMFAQSVAANAITDAQVHDVAYGKITGVPAALPPNGTAGGDLTGTYPNPAVGANKIDNTKLAVDGASLGKITNSLLDQTLDPEAVDQQQTAANASVAGYGLQSFTAGATGYLTGVDVYFDPTNAGGFANFQIFLGDESRSGTVDPVLYTTTTTIAAGAGWQRFNVSPPILVKAGQKYTWFVPGSNNNFVFDGSYGDLYPGGRSALQADDFDLAFRTYEQSYRLTANGALSVTAALNVGGAAAVGSLIDSGAASVGPLSVAGTAAVSGNVAIGSAATSSRLTVAQHADSSSVITIDSGATVPEYSATDLLDRGVPKWGLGKDLSNNFYVDESAVSNRLLIKPGGLVGVTGSLGVGTTTPNAKLDVRGDIRLSSDGSLYAAAGKENLRIVRGTINADGTSSGNGFTSSYISAADSYQITFNPAFSGPPVVTATPITATRSTTITQGTATASAVPLYEFFQNSATTGAIAFIAIGPR